jgi:hypothetical protein
MRLALGPSLGQCCGGIVWLALERIAPDSRRRLAGPRQTRSPPGGACSASSPPTKPPPAGACSTRPRPPAPPPTCSPTAPAGSSPTSSPRADFPVILFGAGHVGEAVVRALAPLGARITWVDTRDDIFPPALPPGVRAPSATDSPDRRSARRPAGQLFSGDDPQPPAGFRALRGHLRPPRLCLVRPDRLSKASAATSHASSSSAASTPSASPTSAARSASPGIEGQAPGGDRSRGGSPAPAGARGPAGHQPRRPSAPRGAAAVVAAAPMNTPHRLVRGQAAALPGRPRPQPTTPPPGRSSTTAGCG